jgi:hypothetical protein
MSATLIRDKNGETIITLPLGRGLTLWIYPSREEVSSYVPEHDLRLSVAHKTHNCEIVQVRME